MKKLFTILIVLALLVIVSTPALAAKPTKCATIQGGTILDSAGQTIKLGYDQWGYNYQANMFNGLYDNNSRPTTPATGGDSLMMKWNDAWLSSQDCNNDGKLDRHLGYPAYMGSGAWLTNHATGTYDLQNVTGSWVVNVNYLGTDYPEDLVLTQAGSDLIGTLALVGGGSPWTIDSGNVTGSDIAFDGYYNSNPSMRVHFAGAIATDGSMTGTWSDVLPGTRTGTWTTTSGTTAKTACTWSDFVKIVAVPSSSVMNGGKWYTVGGVEIGPAIWGEFAIIQEVSSNPCGNDLELLNYKSKLRSGLGNW